VHSFYGLPKFSSLAFSGERFSFFGDLNEDLTGDYFLFGDLMGDVFFVFF